MTRRVVLLMAVLLLLASAPLPGPAPAHAACAGPWLNAPAADTVAVARGERVTVRGRGFADGCQDGVSCTVGCSGGCVENDPAPDPATDVHLRLRQEGRTWDLGTADADSRSEVTWRVVVPAGARPGPARLLADGAGPVRIRLA